MTTPMTKAEMEVYESCGTCRDCVFQKPRYILAVKNS